MEFKKGCPACEHTDPQLDWELHQLAQLLFDSYLEDQGLPPAIVPLDEEVLLRYLRSKR